MKFISLLALMLIGCASQKSTVTHSKPTPNAWPQIEIENFQISPGHIKKISFPYNSEWNQTILNCNEQEMVFHTSKNRATAYIAIGYKEEKKNFDCHLIINQGDETRDFVLAKAKIVKHDYPTRYLNVDQKHVSLSDENIKRWQDEMAMQETIYSSGVREPYFTKPFKQPIDSKITSFYGFRRVFNNEKDSWHSGTDLRAKPNTPVPAANRGKVVYTGELFFNGNTVIIDHGAGIFTMYCHLNKFNSKVGELVPQGAIIAYSGNTGRSTAPHLHWGVKVQSHWVDGRVLVNEDRNPLRIMASTKKVLK